MVITIQSRPAFPPSPLPPCSRFFPSSRPSDLSPVQMLTIFFSVNTIHPLFPHSAANSFVHLRPPTSNPIFQFSSASLELQYHATTFQFCSKFEGWGSMTLLSLNRTRGELRIILFHVSFNYFCDLCGVSNGWEESGEERRMEGI